MNHKPKLSTTSTKSIIIPSKDGPEHSYNLLLRNEDGGEDYLYIGSQQPSEATALIYNPNTQTFTLDRIDSDFRFNLRSTPSNKDAVSLAVQYPQLETRFPALEHNHNGRFDEASNNGQDATGEADPTNPYDYRHFLKPVRQGVSHSPEPSTFPSPMPNHNLNPSPILTTSSSVRPQRFSKPKSRSNPRGRHLSPNPREEADADNEESDNDVLTIDMGESSNNRNSRPWRSVLGALNEGGRSSGPISLRSAASSRSPSLKGDSSSDEDEQSNADVEEIDLGNGEINIIGHEAPGGEVETPGTGWDDADEIDVAAELEQELERQAEQEESEGAGTNGHDLEINGMSGAQQMLEESSEESSEESEEE